MLARIRRSNGARVRRATVLDLRIGERIRERRGVANISQAMLADGCGITFQQIQKYENGTDRISVSRFVKIARVLGIEPEQLLAECIQREAA